MMSSYFKQEKMLLLLLLLGLCWANEPPQLVNDMDNLPLSESTPAGTVVYTLKAIDPEGAPLRYELEGTHQLSVDAMSGDVTLIKPLDREQQESFRVIVKVREADDVSNANEVSVPATVIIIDENDSPPVFEKNAYEAEVGETAKEGLIVINSIKVSDPDLVGETLEIKCLDVLEFGNSCNLFEPSVAFSNTSRLEASLLLKGKLDYAQKQIYQFKLEATDGVHTAITTVHVRVQDEQNLPPVFEGSLAAVVDEDAPIGTLVLTLSARDADQGRPRPVLYELITNPDDYFSLDQKTGELRTAKPLDKEALTNSTGVINLTIKAQEVTSPGDSDQLSSSTAQVTVTVRDVNDEAPRFDKNEYTVLIPENTPLGSPLPGLNMKVSDSDTGINSAFSLHLNDDFGIFSIEPEKAIGSTAVTVRVTNHTLDYEDPNQRKFFLLIVAQETLTKQRLSSTATLVVSVQDVNDNVPVFQDDSYEAHVTESASAGSLVTSITASDRDSGLFGQAGLQYSLEGDGSDRFNVDKKTGAITVAECQEGKPGVLPCLDFETRPIYYLSYRATDNEGEGLSTVVSLKISLTDSNDNPPRFLYHNYRTVVDEGAAKFEPTLQVQAEDMDKSSQIKFSIIGGDPQRHFKVDSQTGELAISNENGLMDSGIVNLQVQASDGEFTDVTEIKITVRDINNNHPVFEKDTYTASVQEDTDIGTMIEQVQASDADTGDNARVSYLIESGAFEHFDIDIKSGAVDVAAKLDFDRKPEYKIRILAVDSGTPALTGTTTLVVNVLNSNDKMPSFNPPTQRAEVSEDAPSGTLVHQLIASDPDVEDPNGLEYQVVDPVSAVDSSGKPVSNPSNVGDFFELNKKTGAVSVARMLDRSEAAVVRITVKVVDTSARIVQEGLGTLVITIVGVNDHPPEFAAPWSQENPEVDVTLNEEVPVGTVVGNFEATDPDSASVAKYEINPDSEYFEINNASGTVKTKQRIDFEKTPELSFRVVAWDSGQPPLSATALISVHVVNINDEDPVFSKIKYQASVRENSPRGTFVAEVSAMDKDSGQFGKISYSLAGEHAADFAIDQGGIIKVQNPSIIDRESVGEIVIQVVANDGAEPPLQRTSSVPVHIIVEDENDHSPKFEQHKWRATVNEDIALQSRIMQLRAKDEDPSAYLSYKITDGDPKKMLHLEEVTGILYSNQSLKGVTKDFILTVRVSDGVNTDEAEVKLTVQAVNQHQPKFVTPALSNATVEVPENAGLPNYLVMTVNATDGDSGDNGRVSYHLKDRQGALIQETDEFTINSETGQLRTKVILDREHQAKYELVLVAKDNGSPISYETLRFLTIVLVDANDNEPKFPEPEVAGKPFIYRFRVTENGPDDQVIGMVFAEDADEGVNAKVYYFLLSGGDGKFSIGKTDGKIKALESLDREAQESYALLVKATNDPEYSAARVEKEILLGGEDVVRGEASITRVLVTVADENDNPPSFEKKEFYAGVNAFGNENEPISQIVAMDPDKGGNGSLEYFIRASNLYPAGSNVSSGSLVPSPFKVSGSGRLSTATSMLEHNQGRFIVRLVARETASPYRESETMVHVWVYDPNQLVRVIVSRPPENVHADRNAVATELSTVTRGLVVLDNVRYHVDDMGRLKHEWSDMYMHVVNPATMEIVPVPQVLKLIDSNYDTLKDYYSGFAIENVVPAQATQTISEKIDPALAALTALLVVLVVGFISFMVVCCCLRHWVMPMPGTSLKHLKRKEALIKQGMSDELICHTENPLWMEQKLKLYEEQELTMQVFSEPDNRMDPSGEPHMLNIQADAQSNMYATLQPPQRNSRLSLGHSPGESSDYATLTRPIYDEMQAARDVMSGFHGSTFQPPRNIHPNEYEAEMV